MFFKACCGGIGLPYDMVGNGFGTSVTDKAVIIRCCAMGYLVGKLMMMPAANPKDAMKFSFISGEKHCQ